MRRVAGGDYSRPVPLGRDPEINDLVEQFNRMAEDLKGLEEMRTDFVSMLSHDLKSPLAVIKMYAEALGAKGGADPVPLQAITRSADRLLRLVENFLDASRAEAAHLELALRPLRLEGLIRRVQEDGQVLASGHGVTVASRSARDAARGARRRGAPGARPAQPGEQRRQVQPARGHRHDRGTGPQGDVVRIAVADTGGGISPADRQQLFVKYFRADRTRHIRGTGLGLAVTREIVRAHGGDLEVASQEGKGQHLQLHAAARPGRSRLGARGPARRGNRGPCPSG